jgi:plastocyanin
MNTMLKLAAAMTVTAFSLNAAEVTGKVTLKGTPPPEKVIAAVKTDANCGKVAQGEAKTRVYVVGADGGLANTVVYIKKGLEGKAFPAPATKVEIDQAGCMYQPYISAVQAKQTVAIKNSDPFMHNVNVTPKAPGNKGFNIAQATQGTVNDKVFETPELGIRFACNVHPWMIAYLNVMENPFFAVSNDKGGFTIKGDLPDGKYTLEAYHQKGGAVTQEIEVKGGKATADFTIEVKAAQ